MENTRSSLSAVFLDRDGVLNDLVDRGEGFKLGGELFRYTAPFQMSELVIKKDVPKALRVMREKGYKLFIVTNQPDVSNGCITPNEFRRMMAVFRAMSFDGVYFCPHRPGIGCACRKPAPGMLLNAARRHGINLASSYMVGDSESDIEAGRKAGTGTMLVSSVSEISTQVSYVVPGVLEAAYLLP